MNTVELAIPSIDELEAMYAFDTPVFNAADSSFVTRHVAQVWNTLADPLIEPFKRLTDANHTLGVVAVNTLLTAPRLTDVQLSRSFVDQAQEGNLLNARALLVAKFFVKSTDGIDGPVARGSGATSKFGAGFDPAVDIVGTMADIWAIMKLAEAEGDKTVIRMMKLGLASDIGAIATGGVLNGVADVYANKHGHQLANSQEARSNADGKLKYGLKSAGNMLLLLSYTCEDPEQKAALRKQGLVLNGASNAMGALSIYKYTRTALGKFRNSK